MAVQLKPIVKAWSKRSRKFEAHQTKPENLDSHTKEIIQCGQQCQAIKRQKSGLGHQRGRQDRLRVHLQSDSNRINRSPYPSFLEDSKIIREGPIVYCCDHVTNVTYKIQCKYPNCNFSKVFYRKSNQNILMAEILSALKKGNAGS